jgi:hypothetical protein
MELSFYSVVTYRATAVAVVLVGFSGFHWRSTNLNDLPDPAHLFVVRVFEQLERRPQLRELRRLRERLGDGPTRLSEPLPVTFNDPEPLLDNLAKRYLSQPTPATG